MLFLVFASTLLVTVYGEARDPTKVCWPDQYQIHVYSLQDNTVRLLAFDNTKKISASGKLNGQRTVTDFAGKFSATINETDGTCDKIEIAGYSRQDIQCLPANAVLLTNETTILGLNPGGLEIEAWEYTQIDVITTRIAVTKSTPAVPVILQSTWDSVLVYFNAKTSIDDPTIFNIPDDCPTVPFVG